MGLLIATLEQSIVLPAELLELIGANRKVVALEEVVQLASRRQRVFRIRVQKI